MYIDAIHEQYSNKVKVSERDKNGNRVLIDYPAEYVFYYSHAAGQNESIYGDACKRYSTNDHKKFTRELKKYSSETNRDGSPKYKIFESDINPIFRLLADKYKNCDTPKLNIGFFDIETGFCEDRGYAPVTDTFNPITAISIYISNIQRCITVVLKPDSMSFDEAKDIADKFEDTLLFDDEAEMLKAFVEIIGDVDLLSGWNSTLYDIPYVVNRMKLILGEKSVNDLCLWNKKPKERMVPKFGKEHLSFDLVGRTHLDYLELYEKHNPQQRHSYRLDYIGEIETGENKIQYTGTLDDLYNKDFDKFIEYSRQDVMLLVKIDEKKQFIELANQIAHMNSVLLKTTMGSVSLVEQAIINEMHSMNLVVPSRKKKDYNEEEEEKLPVVGAYVAKPKTGLHSHVACVDINSLYPSAIRALNISPETIVGQVRPIETDALIEKRVNGGVKRSEAWDGLFASVEFEHMMDQNDTMLTIDFDNSDTKQMTGKQLYEYIFNPANKLCITANGTIFRTDKQGIIPQLLAKWYAERKEQQDLKETYSKLSGDGIQIEDKELLSQIEALL